MAAQFPARRSAARADRLLICLLLAFAASSILPVSAQFSSIRIGDIDGVGFGDGISFGATCNSGPCYRATIPSCIASVNVDSVGVLRKADYIPDLDCSGLIRGPGAGDNFDNRSLTEQNGTEVLCTGCFDNGSSGSDWTDLSLSVSYCNTFPCVDFPDGDDALPNEAVFNFDFFVLAADIDDTQPVFFNVVFGDYDIQPATITLTLSGGSVLNVPIDAQSLLDDGLIQAVSRQLDFNDVFTDASGIWHGDLEVRIDGPNDPYLAVDYVELSSGRVNDCNDNGVNDSLDIANGDSVDGNIDGVPDECCTRIRVSQESSAGAGDFDDNVLGCVDPFTTGITGVGYYGYDGANFTGPAPALVNDRSHVFFVSGRDGLSFATVHDAPDASSGRAEMRFDLFDDPDGALLAITDGNAATGDNYVVTGGTVFESQHHWSTFTDGLLLADLGGSWTMHAQFTPFTPTITVIAGLDSWVVHSADGVDTPLALQSGRRVRFDCCGTCVEAPPFIVGWWPLDETPGFASTAADLARVNNGVHIGPLTRSDDLVDGSLRFTDASTYVYVHDPPDGTLDFRSADLEGDFSIDAWIRPESTSVPIQGIVDKTSIRSPDWLWGYSFYLRDDRLALSIASNAPPAPAVAPVEFLSDPVPGLDDGTWHLVAVTVDRNLTNGVKFYTDAVRVDDDGQDPTVVPGDVATWNATPAGANGSWPLLIGQVGHFFPDAHPFDGHIDEVEIFLHALDDGQIESIYDARADGKCKCTCDVTSQARCCGTSAQLTVTLCNEGVLPKMMSWGPGTCPEIDHTVPRLDPAAWPALGDPVYGPYSVAEGACLSIPVPVDCSTLSSGSRWVYGIEVYSRNPFDPADPAFDLTCRSCGVLTFDPDQAWASWPAGGLITMAPGDPTEVVFELTNPNGAGTFDYVFVADPANPAGSASVSLDGLAPGIPVEGSVFVGSGQTESVSVTTTMTEHDPSGLHEVMLLVDADGFPGFEPMTAAALRSAAPAVHDGVQAGGVADSLAVALEPNGDLTLDWADSCAGTGADFVVYEGSLAGDFSSHLPVSCSTGGVSATTFAPAAGDTYYLTAPRTGTREGSSGVDSGGNPRAVSAAACLPREAPTCE